MSGPRVSIDEEQRRLRADHARRNFEANGVNISEWARERGFSKNLVFKILSGQHRCIRGQSHEIAVALGIKDAPHPPARPLPPKSFGPDRLEPAA